jgi:Family of unknown function (DUF5670)
MSSSIRSTCEKETLQRNGDRARTLKSSDRKKEIDMLWTIFVVLLVLWLLGFSLHVAGGLIHLLLVVALVVLVINLVSGRRSGL